MSKTYDALNLVIPKDGNGGEVYLGNLEAAMNTKMLKEKGIGAVLSVIDDATVKVDGSITHLHIRADDQEFQQIERFFCQTNSFIDSCRKSTNILVHCRAGISRSATILIAYIMHRYGSSAESAFKQVQSKRWFIEPNPSFMKQIKKYETIQNIRNRIQPQRPQTQQIQQPSPQAVKPTEPPRQTSAQKPQHQQTSTQKPQHQHQPAQHPTKATMARATSQQQLHHNHPPQHHQVHPYNNSGYPPQQFQPHPYQQLPPMFGQPQFHRRF